MRILVAEDQAAFRELIVKSLRERTAHEVITAEDGVKALELALAEPRPDVLILDWVMPKLSGTQVCRLVRGTLLHPQPYILFLTARCRREELLQCLTCGADDLLTKPVAPDLLIARLDLAERGGARSPLSHAAERALREAQKEGEGELVVRSGALSARILFSENKIAWIQLADSFGSLLDAMGKETGLDAEAAQEIVAECRRTGKGLGATLSAWGIVEGERLREITRDWLKRKLSSLRNLENPQFLFVPTKQKCSKELLFELDELLESPHEVTGPHSVRSVLGLALEQVPLSVPSKGSAQDWSSAFVMSNEEDSELSDLLDDCMSGEGVLGVVIIERLSGVVLGRQGEALDPDITWAHLHMINAIMRRELVDDAHVGTARHLHLAVVMPQRPEVVVYVLLDSNSVTIATARLALRAAIQKYTQPS